jgi:hypothetical protein
MTRRYPNLRQKQLKRDSKIGNKLVNAWDKEQDKEKVLDIFLKENKNLSNERYWEFLRTVWIICGSIETSDVFRKLMQSNRPMKHYFSTPEEHSDLSNLFWSDNHKIEVHRACNNENDGGLSWTTNWLYALNYQETFNKEKVISKKIKKEDVFAYINRNKESEIILL